MRDKLVLALAWRIRRLAGNKNVDDLLIYMARKWRRLLKHPVFIGIAGSVGKTTCKELTLAVLSRKGKCVANSQSLNMPPEVAKNVLRTRSRHDFTVAEMSENLPGIMAENVEIFAPGICVVTNVGEDHISAFESRENIALEISTLVGSIPPGGSCVLNVDDPLVCAMADRAKCRVISYGLNHSAALRASDVESIWPDRLRFIAHHDGQSVLVQTPLYGKHLVGPALSAIGVGLAVGMDLKEAAEGLGNATIARGRMEPVTTSSGVHFIRDDFKNPHWAWPLGLQFVRDAKAARKIAVIGEISDIRNKKEKRYLEVARLASEVFDITLFVGPWATSALGAARPAASNEKQLFAVRHVRDAAELIKRLVNPGDLVLLKGTLSQDHLERILWEQERPFACWKDDCGNNDFCDSCPTRNSASQPPAGRPDYDMLIEWRRRDPRLPFSQTADMNPRNRGPSTAERKVKYIVGLGNPGSEYVNSPHNLGYAVVDKVAEQLGWIWKECNSMLMASGCIQDVELTLIKCNVAMNNTGRALVRLSLDKDLSPANTLLVFDDVSLELGQVRYREFGSAGGHRGVASTIEAFQSDVFARLKIGSRTKSGRNLGAGLVTTRFSEDDAPVVHEAVESACSVLMGLQ
jgi:aminoacyl-tRNA hydrolase